MHLTSVCPSSLLMELAEGSRAEHQGGVIDRVTGFGLLSRLDGRETMNPSNPRSIPTVVLKSKTCLESGLWTTSPADKRRIKVTRN